MLAAAVLLALGVLDVSGDGGDDEERPCDRFCVTVTPKTGATGTVFRFAGRGWRPDRRVRALHGPYCEGDCPDLGIVSRIRTDGRGRWEFEFRNGPRQPGDREAGIVAGSGLSYFEQWRGKPHRSRLIRRKAPHRVD